MQLLANVQFCWVEINDSFMMIIVDSNDLKKIKFPAYNKYIIVIYVIIKNIYYFKCTLL